jgi:YmgG-like glycine-zipper protein
MAEKEAAHIMRTRLLSGVMGLSMLALTACGTVGGAAVGAGTGAAVGAGTGYGAGKGALIGTGVGAAAGAIYDITKHNR